SLGNQCDASDMVQEIFLKVLEKINTLKDPDLWVAWLFRIAHNKVINLHKKQSLHRMDALQEGMPEPRTENEIAEKLEIERKLSALPELLQEMPDQQAKVLRLKYLDGQSIETLCEELHIKESAVKMRLLRARTQIVKMYEERYRTSA
ncbi:MAG: RNA polymerase sigma factor, partial [Lewinella sp.]|nr:RNA polymerase sigma factor [Lewinella sp.]